MESQEASESTKEEERADKVKAKGSNKNTDGELFSGIITLNIMPPINLKQFKKFEENLAQIQDLRVVLIGGSMAEGNEIIVSAETDIPLLETLRNMPNVAEVNKKGKPIQITLKPE